MKVILMHTGPLSVNTYLVCNEAAREMLVIDPGGNAEEILRRAEAENCRIAAVLLTHAHFDHAGACKELQDAGIPVYVHGEEEINLHSAGNMGRLFGCPMPELRADSVFADGDVLSIAHLAVTVLHTPGHTAGSCCFQIGDRLFSGDTLFFGSAGRTDLIGGDARALAASLRRLCALPGDCVVCPGHGEETTLQSERENNPFC